MSQVTIAPKWAHLDLNEIPNISPDNKIPRPQANLFCIAPMYNGDCFETIQVPKTNVGENFGLIKTPIKKLANMNPEIYGITI